MDVEFRIFISVKNFITVGLSLSRLMSLGGYFFFFFGLPPFPLYVKTDLTTLAAYLVYDKQFCVVAA